MGRIAFNSQPSMPASAQLRLLPNVRIFMFGQGLVYHSRHLTEDLELPLGAARPQAIWLNGGAK